MRRQAATLLAAAAVCACAAIAPVSGPGRVSIPAPGVTLQAQYAAPPGPAAAPAIVALHGCGGPWATRDGQWRDLFLGAGHPVLFPDSFGSRGMSSQCRHNNRGVSAARERRSDTVAAVQWLVAQPGTPPGGVVVVGWSNGGTTALAAAERGVMPPGLVRGTVAFYPGCGPYSDRGAWVPGGPLLIVMGEADDWTPAAPCRVLAQRFPDQITLVLFPGAYHDFDVPNHTVTTRTGLAFTANHNGIAHVGTDTAGRKAVLKLVPEWIAGLSAINSR